MNKNELIQFINEYENHIFDSHAKEIRAYIKLMDEHKERRLIKTEYGEHYSGCIYALDDNILEPDVCECVFFLMRGRNINDLIRKYKTLLLAFNERYFR